VSLVNFVSLEQEEEALDIFPSFCGTEGPGDILLLHILLGRKEALEALFADCDESLVREKLPIFDTLGKK
jgi:hypothetical protein